MKNRFDDLVARPTSPSTCRDAFSSFDSASRRQSEFFSARRRDKIFAGLMGSTHASDLIESIAY